MKTEQPIKVMNKEQQELLNEAYENYWESNKLLSNPKWLKPVTYSNGNVGAEMYNMEEFINKCKTDPEFSETWGLKIYTKVDGDKVWMGMVYNDNAVEIRLK